MSALAGFFSAEPVRAALALSAAASVLCGGLGVLTVVRGQAFAGHALADVSSAGGAAALLLGLSPLPGFLLLGLAGVLGLAGLSPNRAAGRDEAAGILLGAGLGLTALLLHFCATGHGAAGAAQAVMFGAMFSAPPGLGLWAGGLGLAGLAGLALIARPLLLASLDVELARAAGVRVGLVSLLFLLLLALGVTLAAMALGAILATALLIGPAAAALRLVRAPGRAMALAALIGLAACWGGIVLAYASYGWTPGHVWPVSFFIVVLLLTFYALAGLARRP